MATKFKLELSENGVSIQESEQLFDGNGSPVSQSNFRRAIGIGDFGGDTEAFKVSVQSTLESIYGAGLAAIVAENTAVRQANTIAEQARTSALQERDNARAERDAAKAERESIRAELNIAQAEIADLRRQIPDNPGNGGNGGPPA